jgi:pimeloyl-ACP methyl ester carboxylesterase
MIARAIKSAEDAASRAGWRGPRQQTLLRPEGRICRVKCIDLRGLQKNPSRGHTASILAGLRRSLGLQRGSAVLVGGLQLASFLVGMLVVFPTLGRRGFPHSVAFCVLFVLFTYTYWRAVIDGPGYLPFYQQERRVAGLFSDDDSECATLLPSPGTASPDGIVSFDEQARFAKAAPRPGRCIYSKSARRIVIRPDHLCGWVASWVGRRNHWAFILFNLWGFVYLSYFTGLCTWTLLDELRTWVILLLVSYVILGGFFAVMTISFTVPHLINAALNVTNWEDWNDVDPRTFNKGSCCANCKEVCGPKWWLWLLPVSRFDGLTDEQLAEGYPDYVFRTPRGRRDQGANE